MKCLQATHSPQMEHAYDLGLYKFKAPPVYSGMWTSLDWICYITMANGWLYKQSYEDMLITMHKLNDEEIYSL